MTCSQEVGECSSCFALEYINSYVHLQFPLSSGPIVLKLSYAENWKQPIKKANKQKNPGQLDYEYKVISSSCFSTAMKLLSFIDHARPWGALKQIKYAFFVLPLSWERGSIWEAREHNLSILQQQMGDG